MLYWLFAPPVVCVFLSIGAIHIVAMISIIVSTCVPVYVDPTDD